MRARKELELALAVLEEEEEDIGGKESWSGFHGRSSEIYVRDHVNEGLRRGGPTYPVNMLLSRGQGSSSISNGTSLTRLTCK